MTITRAFYNGDGFIGCGNCRQSGIAEGTTVCPSCGFSLVES